jgi:hypothetical protein
VVAVSLKKKTNDQCNCHAAATDVTVYVLLAEYWQSDIHMTVHCNVIQNYSQQAATFLDLFIFTDAVKIKQEMLPLVGCNLELLAFSSFLISFFPSPHPHLFLFLSIFCELLCCLFPSFFFLLEFGFFFITHEL